jgi:signal transduction histidine kinase
MKIFKSIRWRLQLWYGLILVVVLAGFGFTAHQLERGRQLKDIDNELQHRIGVVATALWPSPPHEPDFAGQPFESPPPDWPKFESSPGSDARRRPPQMLVKFRLPLRQAVFFDESDINGFYYAVWNSDGKELARSTNAPAELPALSHAPSPGPPSPQMRGVRREIFVIFPRGETILVGRSIAPELKVLHLNALKLAGVGGIILLLGLGGGWWISSRAIRPIEDIGATAAKISAGDLSQRINVAEAESELGQLAVVLNSTFARLETAFAQQQQFTADAAHELRTPVSVMLTQTQTALTRERSVSEYRETVEACQRASQRMRRLIESLLELARLDAGQEPMKRLKFNLSQTVWDCVELVRPLAAERGVKIHCDLPAVDGHGDAERLAQVVTNLLANAIQYNKAGGEVRISTKLQGSMILLAVSDTGPGISSEDLPHVFERFYRADQSRSSGQTGLGLAISKAIIEAHGGTIEVVSKPGTGTTFTVVLPRT